MMSDHVRTYAPPPLHFLLCQSRAHITLSQVMNQTNENNSAEIEFGHCTCLVFSYSRLATVT